MNTDIDKTYNPREIESEIYARWERNGYFATQGTGTPYCIVIPPPNVTGSLHMGHGFQYSIMDALIRYKRMCGFKTHWQLGTDHAGIATQLLVEQQLAQENKNKHDLGREEFLKRIWQWKDVSHERITAQQRRLGISGDWRKERFTLDEGLSKAVHKVFIDLYEQDLIYRGQRLINWDPILKTAVSDLEVNFVEQQGQLWYIKYLVADSDEFVIIATTRPETILADTAVAVHSDDERYQNLIGKKVRVPLTERVVPIIADTYVDREFGTGCVKITPAHDFNDNAVGVRHKLPSINIFTPEANLNENVPQEYQGLERFAARKKIVAALTKADLIVKVDKHLNKVPKGDRSGTIIEPFLTEQWFVKTRPMAERALAALQKHGPKFIPENWVKIYRQWLERIEDWCISRQLWWGHRIPAWYDAKGKIYVGNDEAEVRKKYKIASNIILTQDEDVLDTWFSSALWPFSSLGWPDTTEDLRDFYPNAVLVTGFDIIFFWVARMTMMGLKFTGEIPFKEVYITGLIRDSKGQKMSKSKGNIIDPLDLIDGIDLNELIKKRTSNLMLESQSEKVAKNTRQEFPNGIPGFGTDALRFTFCAMAVTIADINFDIKRLEGYRNFCTKLWNAARYVLLTVSKNDLNLKQGKNSYLPADLWIKSRLQKVIAKVHEYFASYRFDLLAQTLYDFIWHDYCDWYLELTKPILSGAEAKFKQGALRTLLEVLETTLRLLHPLMPFITAEIWQHLKDILGLKQDSIMIAAYPQISNNLVSEAAEQEIIWLQRIIVAIRNIRGEFNIVPKHQIPEVFYVAGADKDIAERVRKNEIYFKNLLNVTKVIPQKEQKIPRSASAFIDDLELHIPLAGLIDPEAEMARLSKELTKIERDLAITAKKLENPDYCNNAPEAVVVKERAKLAELQLAQEKIRQQLSNLKI